MSAGGERLPVRAEGGAEGPRGGPLLRPAAVGLTASVEYEREPTSISRPHTNSNETLFTNLGSIALMRPEPRN